MSPDIIVIFMDYLKVIILQTIKVSQFSDILKIETSDVPAG